MLTGFEEAAKAADRETQAKRRAAADEREAAAFEERARHLPNCPVAAADALDGLLDEYDAQLREGCHADAQRTEEQAADLARKAHPDLAPVDRMRRLLADVPYRRPRYGDGRAFVARLGDVPVKMTAFEIGNTLPTLRAEALDAEKPFISETGFRSLTPRIGTDGLDVTSWAQAALEASAATGLRPMTGLTVWRGDARTNRPPAIADWPTPPNPDAPALAVPTPTAPEAPRTAEAAMSVPRRPVAPRPAAPHREPRRPAAEQIALQLPLAV